MADLLAVLYARVLRVRAEEPDWPGRDRFILSKGHGCAGLYAVLAERGFFPLSWLDGFYANGSRLTGHVSHAGVPGVEVSTGSLGHGFPVACGMALAFHRVKAPGRGWKARTRRTTSTAGWRQSISPSSGVSFLARVAASSR